MGTWLQNCLENHRLCLDEVVAEAASTADEVVA